MFKLIINLLLLFALVGCKSLKECNNSYDSNYHGSVKVGSPYSVKGSVYIPKLDQYYDEVGTASWYGAEFHCKNTANGELFNKNSLSAAHNTLPLPSVVRVTNLHNRKSVNVVINDRGPFSKNRIIDLSEKAAIILGMKAQGLATVRVQFLPQETNQLMLKISSKQKIYYQEKPWHPFELVVAKYKEQKKALNLMKKMSKLGKVHLVATKTGYEVFILDENKKRIDQLLNQVIKMGYHNAKINYN
jgi:rare lipoprotein A (peptidoglycan hydrolase)